ncbi:uncharacterized protein [Asterias amurensis]|uniref:uncharacterized protein n=1 Tax=Asterias amurensis TaxID=7602 RepID=UPI003AB8DEFF
MGSSASTTSIPNQVGATKTATQNPTIKVHQPNADQKKSPKSETSSNMTEHRHSKDIESDDDDDDFLPSKKSSSDFDDDAFEKFCGEIDTVLKGHSSVIGASHRKSSVSSSVNSGAGRAGIPPASLRREEFPNQRQLSGTFQQQQTFPLHQQEPSHHSYETQHAYPSHGKLSHLQDDQTKHKAFSNKGSHHAPSLPPPLSKKALNPVSSWKMPEELAQREQVLRNRFDDTWYADETAYVGGRNLLQGGSRDGSLMKMKRNSSLMASQDGGSRESKRKEVPSQEREGFEFSKFKAVNKKSDSKKIDKLLPATYKGYNAHMTRQGTLPSLHGGSLTSSDHSSTSTPARSSSGKQLTYNPSEEDLIAYIEKEFS